MSIKEKDDKTMKERKVVSAKTHTQKQIDDYANQHKPNNKAYQAGIANEKKYRKTSQKKAAKFEAKMFDELGLNENLDWMCYSNPYVFN